MGGRWSRGPVWGWGRWSIRGEEAGEGARRGGHRHSFGSWSVGRGGDDAGSLALSGSRSPAHALSGSRSLSHPLWLSLSLSRLGLAPSSFSTAAVAKGSQPRPGLAEVALAQQGHAAT